MLDVTNDPTLAEIVDAAPDRARILEDFDLDYCCGGGVRLTEACADAGVDLATVQEALARIEPGPPADWTLMGPGDLADHVEGTHHAYLHREMGRLSALAQKVAGVHGERHPELYEVASVYEELRADFEPHLMKEERILFPAIRELDRSPEPPAFPFGSVRNPITMMMQEHDTAGDLLARIRQLTGVYAVPDDGCASYHALYTGLAEIESDTHLHVHKENNVLFPAALALETERNSGRT